MHRIDSSTATVDNKFTEGNKTTGVLATVVTADWANAVQEEVATVITNAGLTLDKEDNTQLDAAIDAKIAANSGFANQAQNKVFAGPASGADAAPAFRSLVVADLPALPFTKYYESPEQGISRAGSFTLTHGLGAEPTLVQQFLRCKSASGGYSVGDLIPLHGFWPSENDADRVFGCSLACTSTTIFGKFATYSSVATPNNPFWVINKSTGYPDFVDMTDWRLIVRAWA